MIKKGITTQILRLKDFQKADPAHMLCACAALPVESTYPVMIFTRCFIDFSDPIRNQAIHFGWSSRQVVHLPKGGIPSIWVLVTRNGDFLERLGDTGRITGWSRATPKPINWTDDFHNLLQALR